MNVRGQRTSANQEFHARDKRWRDAAEAERVLAAERTELRGRLPLRLPVVELEPGDEVSAATALRPRHAVVGYVGREQLLADLAAWCERETAGTVSAELWFVTGGGGFGKTRLAVEACREAEARGWTAGLLPPRAGDSQVQALAEWPGRLLIAVDYAETRPALVGRLVDELTARSPRPPARILLLVRRQAARADLLRMFNEQREERLGVLLRRAPLSRLDDTADEVDRLKLFGQAMADFSALPGPPPGRMSPPRLLAAHFARPLYILTAAYLARMSAGADVDALGETDLLRELLAEHEALHWERWDERRDLRLDPEDRRAAVAVATLLTAHGESEALTVARLIPNHDEEPKTRLIAIARWLAQLYPPAANAGQLILSPLEPDRLGEVLVGDTLREHAGMLAAACNAASDRQLPQALTVTGRVAQSDIAIRDQLRAVLNEHLGDFLGRALASGNGELLAALNSAMTITRPAQGASDAADRFPETLPVWVRPLVAEITALAVDGLRARAESDPAITAELARMLGNLGVRLGEVGRAEEALAAAQEAVALYRQLAEASPAYLSDLAGSVNNLGNFLAGVGRREEALTAAREAVAIRRQLAEDSPAYLPDLAGSLNNLGSCLAEVGRREEALAAAQEAVALYRQLAEASPAAYLPDLATSLNNLGNRLAGVGRPEEALTAAREAVAIRRQLAEANPAAYLPDLAGSLNNLSASLTDVGRQEEALTTDEEAVAIRRQLAEAYPAAYLPYLATSLNNLAVSLRDVGRREEALTTAREAVAIRRRLAEAYPAAYLPDLATSLNNLGNRLAEVGRPEEALTTAREAVAIRRELAEAYPAAYLPDLATSLNNLGNYLAQAGRAVEAEQLLRDVLGSFEHRPLDTGHIVLARGRWLLTQRRLGEAVNDLITAVSVFSQARDRRMRGQVRQVLRHLRQNDQPAFDAAWDQAQGPLPVWLQHPDTDSELTGIVIAWVRTPDWVASRAYFDNHAASLLTDRAEAMLEHLIDTNPAVPELRDHLVLLQAARAHGPAVAYAAHADQRLADRLTQTLDDWIDTQTWDQSQAFAVAHTDDLLDPTTMAILDGFAEQDLSERMLRLHRGLLRYAAISGFDAAYALRADPGQRRAMLAGSGIDLPAGTRLALARLHSGQSADDPEAHFQLATATVLAGIPDEAAAALADCADNAAPFERRDFARRLRELTAGQPQLAAITAELEQILLTTRDTPAPGESGDIGAELAGDPFTDLLLAWIDTPTWEESEAFVISHSKELLTIRSYAALSQLAAARPGDNRLAVHVNLLRAVLAQGITAAYAQLKAELAQARQTDMLREWVSLAADPAASAAYLAKHAGDLDAPQAIALLAAECDRAPGDTRLWQHLGLLMLGEQAADGYAAAEAGDSGPLERSAALLGSGDLDQALAWACLARAADPGPGALLMGQIQTRRGQPDRAREAVTTATVQIDSGRLDEVLNAYDQLIAAQPDDPWLHGEHADALQRAGRPDDALAAWDHALSLAPDNPSLHFNKAHLLFGQSRFEDAQAELLTVTRLRPGDMLGAAVLLAAIAWPADTSQARQYLQAALTSPGERLTPFTRAFYRAITLAGLGRTEDAISELEAAASSRTRQETSLDDTDTALLNRFRDPPLPSLELILQFFETLPVGPQAQEQSRRPTETTDPPSPA